MVRKTVVGPRPPSKPKPSEGAPSVATLMPHGNIDARLEREINRLLEYCEGYAHEEFSVPQYLNALLLIQRMRVLGLTIKKGTDHDGAAAGSAVAKFSRAFEQNAGGRRPNRRGAAGAPARFVPPAIDDESDANAFN